MPCTGLGGAGELLLLQGSGCSKSGSKAGGGGSAIWLLQSNVQRLENIGSRLQAPRGRPSPTPCCCQWRYSLPGVLPAAPSSLTTQIVHHRAVSGAQPRCQSRRVATPTCPLLPGPPSGRPVQQLAPRQVIYIKCRPSRCRGGPSKRHQAARTRSRPTQAAPARSLCSQAIHMPPPAGPMLRRRASGVTAAAAGDPTSALEAENQRLRDLVRPACSQPASVNSRGLGCCMRAMRRPPCARLEFGSTAATAAAAPPTAATLSIALPSPRAAGGAGGAGRRQDRLPVQVSWPRHRFAVGAHLGAAVRCRGERRLPPRRPLANRTHRRAPLTSCPPPCPASTACPPSQVRHPQRRHAVLLPQRNRRAVPAARPHRPGGRRGD